MLENNLYYYQFPLFKCFGQFKNHIMILSNNNLYAITSQNIFENFEEYSDKRYYLLNYENNSDIFKALSLILRSKDNINNNGDIFKDIRAERQSLLYKEIEKFREGKNILPRQFLLYAALLYKYNDRLYNFSKSDIHLLDIAHNPIVSKKYITSELLFDLIKGEN